MVNLIVRLIHVRDIETQHIDCHLNGKMLVGKSHQSRAEVEAEIGDDVIRPLRIRAIAIKDLALPESKRKLCLVEHGEALGIPYRDIIPQYGLGGNHLLYQVIILDADSSTGHIDGRRVKLEHISGILHSKAHAEIVLEHIAECRADTQPVSDRVDIVGYEELIIVVVMNGIICSAAGHPGAFLYEHT